MRVAYKALVERFDIPRPTLIDWQKRLKEDEKNWRSRHLNYLRNQLIVEEETIEEISQKGIEVEDYFIWLVFLFFNPTKDSLLSKKDFIKNLRHFAVPMGHSVEYQHPFSKKIWQEVVEEDKNVKMIPYVPLIAIVNELTIAQYYCLNNVLIEILEDIKNEHLIVENPRFLGSTWQELHTYDKAFAVEKLSKRLKAKGLI